MELHVRIAEIYWLKRSIEQLRTQFQQGYPNTDSTALSSATHIAFEKSRGELITNHADYLTHKEGELFTKELEVCQILLARGVAEGAFDCADKHNPKEKINLRYVFNAGKLDILLV